EIKKVGLATNDPLLADSLDHLGIVYQEMDDNDKAIECYKKVLNIKRKTLPLTHPSLSASLNNLGVIYRQQDDYDQALEYYIQALQVETIALAFDHLDLADTYNSLCTLCCDQAKYKKALEMAELRLNILKKHFGDDNEQVQQTKLNIGEINEEINRQSPYNEQLGLQTEF
ncbi:unnamed protein product, partial [Rotaria sp. Silwood1]